jgi:hypothetical protein
MVALGSTDTQILISYLMVKLLELQVKIMLEKSTVCAY